MQNSRFQCLSKRKKSQRDACLKSTDVQEVDMYVLEAKGFSALWIATQKKLGLSESQIDAKAVVLGLTGFAATNGSAMHDIRDFYLLAEDLKKGGSILSKYEVVQNGDKSYIKFKGNHKLRSLVKGTRYLSNNAKVIALGIGEAGRKASANSGVLVTVIYSVAFRTLELALTKNYSVGNWVVNVSADVVIAAIGVVIGIMAGTAASTLGIVVAPLFTMGVVAYASGSILSYIDGRYLVKEKIVKALNDHIDNQVKEKVNNTVAKGFSHHAVNNLRSNSIGMVF